MDQDRKHQAELIDLAVRIKAGEKLIAEQKARVDRLRGRGLGTTLSLHLLSQLQFSLWLLTRTRDLIRRELQGVKVPGARIAADAAFLEGHRGGHLFE
jgi:hypothetical protein